MSIFNFRKWDNRGTTMIADFVRQILINAGTPAEEIDLRDQDYRGISDADFEQIKEIYCPFGDIPYREKVFECEDFVYRLWAHIVEGWADKTKTSDALALACGFMGGVNADGGGHAWFWRIDEQGVLKFYEGQTGQLMARQPLSIYSAEA